MIITREELAFHPVKVDKTYPAGALDYQSSDFRQVRPLSIDAVAELMDVDIRIRGHLETGLEADCDRCAMRFEFPVECNFDLAYRPASAIAREEEIEVGNDELEVGFFTGEGVELADVIREQVILALPMKMLCEPDCRGLCPRCGTNLNLAICKCAGSRLDSPFASLIPGSVQKG